MSQPPNTPRRLLITAGPTQEPIDAVRYIGNRSSGRLGVALALAAADRGWRVSLLLGPTPRETEDSRIEVARFRTTADLEGLLAEHAPRCDALIMAAAVADFRPVRPSAPASGASSKIRRTGERLSLELEPTPDLLAGLAANRRPGQVLVGFALEPRESLMDSARAKLERKGVDLIVANPLETMDAPTIEAWLLSRSGRVEGTDGAIAKERFAVWLLARIEAAVEAAGSAACA